MDPNRAFVAEVTHKSTLRLSSPPSQPPSSRSTPAARAPDPRSPPPYVAADPALAGEVSAVTPQVFN
jgi:hypothetical protein